MRARGTDSRPNPADSLARHPWVVYIAATLLAFPVLETILHGQQALQFAHDVFDDDVPRLYSIAADWRVYGPSLWDTHLTGGNALFAQFALPPTTPDVLLSFILPPFVAYMANLALIAFLAGWGMHLFLRDSLRLTSVACFAGGLIAAFGFWHYIYGYAAPLFPLLLWSVDRALAGEPGRRGPMVLAVALATFTILAGQIQIVALEVALAVPYVLLSGREHGPWPRRLARFGSIWILAGFVAAPVIVSLLVAVPTSQRGIWDLPYLTPGFGEAVSDAIRRYASMLFGVRTADIGGPGDIYGTYFAGALGLPLLAVSLAIPRGGRERYLLALLALIPAVDLATNLATNLATSIFEHVPLLASFQFVRVRHLVPVLVGMNAAMGLNWLVTASPGAISRVRSAAAGVLLTGALAAVGVAATVALLTGAQPGQAPLVHSGWLAASISLAAGLALASAIATISALRWLPRRDSATTVRLLPMGLALVLLLGLGAERFVWARAERYLDGHLGTWAASVTPTPGLNYIASQPPGGRVLVIGEDANRAMSAGLDTVGGYETVYPLRYHELFGLLIAPQLAVDPSKEAYYNGWGNRAYAFGPRFSRPIADLLGARWLYVDGTRLTDPSLIKRYSSSKVTVYENPTAFERAFIVHQAQILPDRRGVLSALSRASTADLRNTAYVASTDVRSVTALPGAAQNKRDQAILTNNTPDRVVITTETKTAGILVLTDTCADGWTAEVDGQSAPILPVDDALRGVAIPPGRHVVSFSYRPVPTLVAFGVSGLTLVGLAGWWGLGLIARRRTGVPAQDA